MAFDSAFTWTEYSFAEKGVKGAFHVDGDGQRVWSWQFCSVDELPDLIVKANARGWTAYHSVFRYCSPQLSEYKVGDFFIDFDGSGDLEEPRRECLRVIEWLEERFGVDPGWLEMGFSGKKGFYCIIPQYLFTKSVIPGVQAVYRAIAEVIVSDAPTLDTGIYGKRRMWRACNSLHTGSDLYKINLTRGELESWSINKIKRNAGKPRSIYAPPVGVYCPLLSDFVKKVVSTVRANKLAQHQQQQERSQTSSPAYSSKPTLETLPPKWKDLLSWKKPKERNEALTKLTCFLLGCGCSYAETEREVLRYFHQYCDKSDYDEDKALVPLKHYGRGRS